MSLLASPLTKAYKLEANAWRSYEEACDARDKAGKASNVTDVPSEKAREQAREQARQDKVDKRNAAWKESEAALDRERLREATHRARSQPRMRGA